MEKTNFFTRILEFRFFYTLLQAVVGSTRFKRWYADHIWRFEADTKVIDVGCGEGKVLDFVDVSLNYVGLDTNPKYIDYAKSTYGQRGTFFCGTTDDFINDEIMQGADMIFCQGVLHHLTDEQILGLFEFVKKNLKSGGRFLCAEPVFLIHQSKISRRVMGWDRGKNIKTEDAWKKIFSDNFPIFKSNIATEIIRLPYKTIILQCSI